MRERRRAGGSEEPPSPGRASHRLSGTVQLFENHPMVVNLESLHLKDSTEDNRNNGMQCIASADREASGRQRVELIHSVFTESLLSIS